ncbi:MAG: amidohydrolase, partial [Chloroflexi bacterium]|nr:amidohydrolase [Chloroflexota bacterium]
YKDALYQKADRGFYTGRWAQVIEGTPALSDVYGRLRLMDKYDGLVHVLSVASPAIEEAAAPETAVYLASLVNDEIAELCAKYPNKFIAAVACLPMNDVDAALKEAERAVKDLGFRGVQVFTPVNGKPLDSPEFMPLYEMMSRYDLPIWIHPARGRSVPDYSGESHSKYYMYQMFGWPYETTAAMVRLVFSGVLEKYPNIKFITHHCGAMIPYFAERITVGQDYAEVHLKTKWKQALSRPPIDYFRMFYGDTALNGSTAAVTCGYDFFGTEHIVFGTDFPYDDEDGNRFTREVIRSVELMDIPEENKMMIFETNARRLLHLNEAST